MKPLFTLFLLILFSTLSAQDSYLFKVEYQENTVYNCVFTSESRIQREGGPLELQHLHEDKVIKNKSAYIIKTGAQMADGNIPYEKSFVVADEETNTSEDDVLSDLKANMSIIGFIENDSKMILDTILGIDPELVVYQSYRKNATNNHFNIPFPKHPLKVGDSFNWSDEPSRFEKKLTLIKVENDLAFFNYTGTKKNNDDSEMSKSLDIKGTLIFDLSNNFMSQDNAEMIIVNDAMIGNEVSTATFTSNMTNSITLE